MRGCLRPLRPYIEGIGMTFMLILLIVSIAVLPALVGALV